MEDEPERELPSIAKLWAAFITMVRTKWPVFMTFARAKFREAPPPMQFAVGVVGTMAACATLWFIGWIMFSTSPKTNGVTLAKSGDPTAKITAPNDDDIFTRTIPLVRKFMKHPAAAKFSDTGTVQALWGAKKDYETFRVIGRVKAKNGFGDLIEEDWSADVRWYPLDQRLEPEMVYIGDVSVYQCPEYEEAFRKALEAMGNGVRDLPDDLAREIRNVQAACVDVLRPRYGVFQPQWPDDPARPEFKIHIDSDGLWEVTGKIERFNGTPRSELYAQFRRRPLEAVCVRVNKQWLVVKPKDKVRVR